MSYIDQIPEEQAEGPLRALYEHDLQADGYVSHTTWAFSHRPDVLAAFRETQRLVRSHLRLRQYELVTLAAAAALGCRYCMLAHGEVLRKNGFSLEQVQAVLTDFRTAGLTPAEVHMCELGRKLSLDPHAVTPEDVRVLHADGFTDAQITDIALAAAVRNFYSRYFESLGIQPDEEMIEREPELWAFISQAARA